VLIEKEVIRPGTYWYRDEQTGLPRKLVVTPELTKYWCDQGNKMVSFGLPIPVPYEHDFTAHPMTPKDKLLNNAGEVAEYRMKGDVLFSSVDIRDPDVKKKIGHSIRWTSPWISSFTDGDGRQWNNVISHLALTTRPRVVEQSPFNSIAAALSMASEVRVDPTSPGAVPTGTDGFCLSRAGRISVLKENKRLVPRYPLAFSMWAGGIKLADDDVPPKKKEKKPSKDGATGDSDASTDTDDMFEDSDTPPPSSGAGDGAAVPPPDDGGLGGAMDPLADAGGDVKMEELLCDLLQALGVPMPDMSNEHEFKRHLYEAVMSKIKELTSKGMGDIGAPDQNQPPTQQPNASQPGGGQNPLIQQEQQPMFMSLEEINKLPDPTMKNVALSMYAENQKLRAEMDSSKKVAEGLRDAKLKEAAAARDSRIALIGKVLPSAKADLDAMVKLPGMALSMGEGGAVVDPMAQTLAVLDKAVANIPTLHQLEQSALSVAPHPTDGTALSREKEDELSEDMARMMGCAPQKKAG
jgi:hypothetical protein